MVENAEAQDVEIVADDTIALTDEQRAEFAEIAIRTVNRFQDNLHTIANIKKGAWETPDEMAENMKNHIEYMLRDFINNGRPPRHCEGQESCGAMMFVSSLNSDNPTAYRIRKYLYRLANNNYDSVLVDRAQACYVSKFRSMGTDSAGNTHYVATATYWQVFCGFMEGKPTYCDKTEKDIEVYLICAPTEPGGDCRIKLGDTEVKDTTPYKP